MKYLPSRNSAARITLAATAVATLVAGLSACSSAPGRNPALDQARASFDAVQMQGKVVTLAPEELQRAADALRTAEAARVAGESISSVDHLAYLASQRVSIAQDTANSRAALAVTAGAAAERDRMRLAQRTQEADTAQNQLANAQRNNANTQQALNQQLAQSQQTAAQRSAELALAQQNAAQQAAELARAAAMAQDDRQRLERRNAQLEDLQAQIRDMNGRQTERGIVVTLGDLLFATGQARLQADGSRNLAKLAEFLKRNPERTAAIEGYTDSVGSESANQTLSDRRANAVLDELVNQGVAGGRLRTEAFGESRPVASNDNASGRQMNRRVEVIFAPQAGDVVMK